MRTSIRSKLDAYLRRVTRVYATRMPARGENLAPLVELLYQSKIEDFRFVGELSGPIELEIRGQVAKSGDWIVVDNGVSAVYSDADFNTTFEPETYAG